MRRLTAILLSCMILLSGCGMSVEDLYALPEATSDYYDLQTALNTFTDVEMRYLSPVGGVRREPVQLIDLDLDGEDEAIAFFQSALKGTLHVCVFGRLTDHYELRARIDCEGSAFTGVDYAQLDGEGGMDLLLRCQNSETAENTLQVFRFDDSDAVEMLRVSCDEYHLVDLDLNEIEEIVVLSDPGEDSSAQVGYYAWSGREMTAGAQQTIRCPYGAVTRVAMGLLEDGVNSVMISGTLEGKLTTDVFIRDGGALKAVQSDRDVLQTQMLRSSYVYPDDADGDSKIDFPVSEQLPAYDDGSTAQSILHWYTMGSDGTTASLGMTYINVGENWTLRLMTAWKNNLTIKESIRAEGATAIESAGFYRITDEGNEEILTIYSIRGENRMEFAEQESLTILSDSTILVAVRINEAADQWDGSVTLADISEGFKMLNQDNTAVAKAEES